MSEILQQSITTPPPSAPPGPVRSAPPLYPVVQLDYRQYTSAILRETKIEMAAAADIKLDHKKRLIKQASELQRCMAWGVVSVCDCGQIVENSGAVVPERYSCHHKACPACNRARAGRLSEWSKSVFKDLPALVPSSERRRYSWRFLTITKQYTTSDPNALSIAGMKKRVEGMKKLWSGLWGLISTPGAGAFRAVEIAGTGNIHAHVLHYGPYIPKRLYQSYAEENGCFIQIRGVGNGPNKGRTDIEKEQIEIARSIKEICKYSAKGPGSGPKSAKWFAGREQKFVMNPVLMVRWQAATVGARLCERYGSMRKLKAPEECEEKNSEQIELLKNHVCKCCGCIGEKPRMKIPFQQWVQIAYIKGWNINGPPIPGDYDVKKRKKG